MLFPGHSYVFQYPKLSGITAAVDLDGAVTDSGSGVCVAHHYIRADPHIMQLTVALSIWTTHSVYTSSFETHRVSLNSVVTLRVTNLRIVVTILKVYVPPSLRGECPMTDKDLDDMTVLAEHTYDKSGRTITFAQSEHSEGSSIIDVFVNGEYTGRTHFSDVAKLAESDFTLSRK